MKSVYQVKRENISLYTGNTIEVVFETKRKRERLKAGLTACTRATKSMVTIPCG